MDLLISIIIATIVLIIIFTSKKASIKAKVFYSIAYMIFLLYAVNERQFCLSNFSFNYDEKVKNHLSGLIESRIKYDKYKRGIYYKNKGYSQKQIDEIILSLENKYQKERKKIFNYCKVSEIDFLDYFDEFHHKYSNCIFDHDWEKKRSLDWIHIEYRFDKESYDFFNEIVEFHSQNSLKAKVSSEIQIHHYNPNVKWYKEVVNGLIGSGMFSNGCDTYYNGNGYFNSNYTPIHTDINSSIAKKYILDTYEGSGSVGDR